MSGCLGTLADRNYLSNFLKTILVSGNFTIYSMSSLSFINLFRTNMVTHAILFNGVVLSQINGDRSWSVDGSQGAKIVKREDGTHRRVLGWREENR